MPQVFHYNFPAFDVLIAWLDCTILAITIAVILEVLILAESALPKHEMGCHEHFFSEFLVEILEISEEVEGSVIRGSVPEVVFHSIIGFVHVKACHDGDLL